MSMQAIVDLMAFLKPDWTKADKPKLKSGAALLADAMKNTTTWPGDFDDTLWDQLKNIVNILVDKIGVTDPHPTVGAEAPPTMTEINEFFSVTGLDKTSEVGKTLMRHPHALGLLRDNFSPSEQKQLVGNPFLIGLLTILGPLVLDFLKAWLAKLNNPTPAKNAKMEAKKEEKTEEKPVK